MTINNCWDLDPLKRPSAAAFIRFLTSLQGKSETWMPANVVDLAGKVTPIDSSENLIGILHYRTVWKCVYLDSLCMVKLIGPRGRDAARKRDKEHFVHMHSVK